MTGPALPGSAVVGPKISVVTSCFNAMPHVADTVRSVLAQQPPGGCEYIVVDGGSSDGTLDVLERHAPQFARLVVERDDGQYHGIQKGMALASGEVMAWLNADDLYLPWTLSLVSEVFARFPQIDWLIGTPSYMNEAGHCTRVSSLSANAYPRAFIRQGWFRPPYAGFMQQESMFWRRSLWERVGGLDLRWRLAADFDLWRRFAEHAELVSLGVPLALFRQRPGKQRSSVQEAAYMDEVARCCAGLAPPPAWWRAAAGLGERARHLARLMNWHEAPVVAWSARQQQWTFQRLRRPVARTTLAELLLEDRLRRRG